MPDAIRRRTRPVLERFLEKVVQVPETGCWEWKSTRMPTGYGQFWIEGRHDYAHRVAFRLFVGEIPAGEFVRHRCDNPSCCNPEHLDVGTHQQNQRDMVIRCRSARGTRNAMATLNPEAVREIRRVAAEGDLSQRQIARRFGVSQSTVSEVVAGRRWRHVD